MNTKNASHKFTFSLYKLVGQMIFFCYNENKQKETFKSMQKALPSVSDSNRTLIHSSVGWASGFMREVVSSTPAGPTLRVLK